MSLWERLRSIHKGPLAVAALLGAPLFFCSLMAASLAIDRPRIVTWTWNGKTNVRFHNTAASVEARIWLWSLVPLAILLGIGLLASLWRFGGFVSCGAAIARSLAVTHRVNEWANEIQAGSYALMDSQYGQHQFGFRQALFIEASVISVNEPGGWFVADCGLKALGMDHGNPEMAGPGSVRFCSDEHVTVSIDPDGAAPSVGDRVRIVPAHCDPTVAYHEQIWLVNGDEVLQRWAVDLRGW